MKINVLNTSSGFVPLTDEDYEEKKKLKIGREYQADFKMIRNYEFHKKFFALINCAFEYLNEEQTERLGGDNRFGRRNFRKEMLKAAGVVDMYYSITRDEMVIEAKSISFGNMDEAEFRDVYDAVKGAIFRTVLRGISEEEFNRNLIGF